MRDTYEGLMVEDFCGFHQIEAVCKFICYKATISRPKIALKYAQLAKRLENEVEGGTNRFPDVFSKVLEDMVLNSISEAGMLHDQNRQKIAGQITTFLAYLFNESVIAPKLFSELVRAAEMRSSMRFEPHLKLLKTLVGDKLKALGFSDFDELYTQTHLPEKDSNQTK